MSTASNKPFSLSVNLPDNRSYPIYIGENLLTNANLFLPYLAQKTVVIVTNETIAPLYLGTLKNTLEFSGIAVHTVILPDGEEFKNLETLNTIYTALLEHRCERKVTLIALGGGVIGDITGYAAATFLRGVNFIQVPTTLLSQVDSSVGGKTGVNHPLGKNMIGAFYQPKAVIADIKTLNTLPNRELSAGLAEVIKYGLIRDKDFFDWLELNLPKLLDRDPATLIHAVARSCKNKAEIVEEDEHESGVRAYLNLGHTFGHAIEVGMGYGKYLHGEAVGIGMQVASEVSAELGHLSVNDVERVRHLLTQAKLPTNPKALNMKFDDWLRYMSNDKKVEAGKIRFVLLKQLGEAFITSDVSKTILQKFL